MWAQMLNSDWWKQTEFGEGVRQYEQNFAEQQRQYNQNYNLDMDKFNETVRQYNENLAEEQRQFAEKLAYDDKWNQAELGYKYSALKQDQDQFDATMEYNKTKNSGGKSDSPKSGYVIREDENGNKVEYKEATQTMMKDGLKAYNEGGTAGLKKYLASVPESYDIKAISDYAYQNGESWVEDYDEYSGWSLSKDTYNGGFLGTPLWSGVDHNDTFIKEGTTYSYDELAKKINASNMPDEKKKELLKSLQNQSKK